MKGRLRSGIALRIGSVKKIFLLLLLVDLLEKHLVLMDEVSNFGFKSVDLGNSLLVDLFEHHVLVREIMGCSSVAAGIAFWGLVVRVDGRGRGVRDLSLDKGKELDFSSLEKIVEVNVEGVHGALLSEVVHVELSDERVHLVVLEVDWKDSLSELLEVLDDKEVSTVTPAHNVTVALFFEKLVSLADE